MFQTKGNRGALKSSRKGEADFCCNQPSRRGIYGRGLARHMNIVQDEEGIS